MKIKQYKGLKAVKQVQKISDAQVMQELENIRRQRTQVVEVTDRPAQNGDEVIIDYAGFVGDFQFPGGTAEQQPLTLGSGMFIPGFEEQLVGANVGDKVDVKVTFPTQYHAEELAGKEAVFHCTVHAIQTKNVPELNDEFAKQFNGISSLEDMKEQLKAQLQVYADQYAQNKVRDELLKELVKQVEDVGCCHTILLAHYADVLAVSVNCHIARHCKCLEDCNLVASNVKLTWLCNLTKYKEFHVCKLNVYSSVGNISAINNSLCNLVSNLLTALACTRNLADNRHVEVAILINCTHLERLAVANS